MIRGIGIRLDDDLIGGRLAMLEQTLERLQPLQLDLIELYVPALNWVRGGRLAPEEIRKAERILSRFGLALALHAPNELSLTRGPHHREVMGAILELAGRTGAGLIVYHSGQIALHDAARGLAPLPDDEALQRMWDGETALLIEYGLQAQRDGIALAVENRDPHLWEIAALAAHGRSADDLVIHHQGMRLDLIAEQVKAVGLANVGICLDVGHAFLAAPYWPQSDYLAAIRACAPLVNHLHFHDNFGRLDDVAEPLPERLVFGEADTHLPPGWGRIPLADVLKMLSSVGYSGFLVLEIRPRYLDYFEEAVASTRQLLRQTAKVREP